MQPLASPNADGHNGQHDQNRIGAINTLKKINTVQKVASAFLVVWAIGCFAKGDYAAAFLSLGLAVVMVKLGINNTTHQIQATQELHSHLRNQENSNPSSLSQRDFKQL